jgi:flavin reductase (DIM6/NTAB) family NADH-FMN oxidoreductase RutF
VTPLFRDDTPTTGQDMFVDTRTAKDLNRGIFNAIVGPRPIGWISTQAAGGRVNLAPPRQR